MHNALTRKLEGFLPLSDEDRRALGALVPRIRQVAPRTDLVKEGDAAGFVHLVLDGFACRYKMLPDGKRQIMAYLVPGDFCGVDAHLLDAMDHSIGTISECSVADIPHRALERLMAERPELAKAFRWCALVDESVLLEWLVNIGGRTPDRRIAHVMCEMLARLGAVGQAKDETCAFPFTQTDLGDTLGLSCVHVNRTIKTLRAQKLITLKGRVLKVHDLARLRAYCAYSANYLHTLDGTGQSGRGATRLARRGADRFVTPACSARV